MYGIIMPLRSSYSDEEINLQSRKKTHIPATIWTGSIIQYENGKYLKKNTESDNRTGKYIQVISLNSENSRNN